MMASVATMSVTAMLSYRYNGLLFTVPTLIDDGLILRPQSRRKVMGNSLILQSVGEVWDIGSLATVREPVVIDSVPDHIQFSSPKSIRILDMPVKFPGEDYRLPLDAVQFMATIQSVIDYEHSINSNADDCYAYLTVDQGYIEAGATQRKQGCHVDGFQGARVTKKLPINRSYVVSDMVPTAFYVQPFHVERLDERYDNFFSEFDRQAQPERVWHPSPYDITLMDAYTVHKAETTPCPVYRTFLRLSYTMRIFDRLGNAHNPLFDYQWEMVSRDTQSELVDVL